MGFALHRIERFDCHHWRYRIRFGCEYRFTLSNTHNTAHPRLYQVEYKGKGYFSGKAHSYKAVLSHHGKTLKSYDGTWTGVGKVSKSDEIFTDATVPKHEVTVKPVDQQGEWESRKLWQKTAAGIRSGDYDAASKDKTRIEVSGGVSSYQRYVAQ